MELIHTDLQINGLDMLVPAFEADSKWTDEERRHMKVMLTQTKGTLRMNMTTMVELRTTAERIVVRLTELTT